jgi:hypothetical protein
VWVASSFNLGWVVGIVSMSSGIVEYEAVG